MFIFRPIGGGYREFQGIKFIAEPRNISLYRSLLPEQFTMPKQPALYLFIADYIKVTIWPFKILPWSISRYQEVGVFIRTSYQGFEGWYCLDMPISNWISMALGRYLLGFPKRVVDKISLEKEGNNWHGLMKDEDKTVLNLKFTPGLNRSLSPWEEEILNNEALFEGSAFLLFPAEKGPGINKVILEEVVTPKWSPELGMVAININSDKSWANLIENNTSYLGMYSYFIGGNNLRLEKLKVK